jgi:hypothetical protein
MPNLGFRTTFNWDGEDVAKLTAVNGIELALNMVDATTHDSADYYREVTPGLITPGDVTLEGYFDYTDTAGQHAMLTDFNARASKTGIITFPAATGATWTFTGYISRLKIGDAPIEGNIPFTASIKPTGKPEFAVATSTGLTTPFFTISESAVIVPDAANDDYTYVATVLTGVESVTVTPTATAGTITVNGNTVATGEASSAITLGDAGSVTEIVIVVTETSKAPVTYTIYLTRASGA